MENNKWQLSRCGQMYFQTVLDTWIVYLCIAVNVILTFTAIVGSVLILIALQRGSLLLHSPSKLLFRCLASTDLCVGLITQPSFVVYLISREVDLDTCVLFTSFLSIFSVMLCGISLCTLTIISVDRLLALLLGLRYRHVVTVARVRGITLLSYFVLLLLLTMMCFLNTRIFTITLIFNVLLFLVISTFCYLKIYLTLRCRQAQVQQETAPRQFNGPSRVHELKYKRSVSTTMLVSIFMIACYLPFAIFATVIAIHQEISSSSLAAEGIVASLVYFNSSINPVIYCLRIREVRKAVKATIRRFCFFYS